jgi:beta-phosphoglucomutase
VNLRGVIFDFDGVIANSEPLHFQGFRDVVAAAGATLSEADYYSRYLGFDDAGAFAAMSADQGLGWSRAAIDTLVARKAVALERLEAQQSVLFPGAADAIQRLAAAGPLAIASGALRGEILRTLEKEGLRRHFAVVVGAEDTPQSKPDPAPYRLAVERLAATAGGSAGEYVAIEDSHWGLDSARGAGLRTVAITNTYAAETLTADLVVRTLDEVTWPILQHLVRASD